jgi:hypothetical protein
MWQWSTSATHFCACSLRAVPSISANARLRQRCFCGDAVLPMRSTAPLHRHAPHTCLGAPQGRLRAKCVAFPAEPLEDSLHISGLTHNSHIIKIRQRVGRSLGSGYLLQRAMQSESEQQRPKWGPKAPQGGQGAPCIGA